MNALTIGYPDGETLIEFRPETRRTHQIRMHARGLGLPRPRKTPIAALMPLPRRLPRPGLQ